MCWCKKIDKYHVCLPLVVHFLCIIGSLCLFLRSIIPEKYEYSCFFLSNKNTNISYAVDIWFHLSSSNIFKDTNIYYYRSGTLPRPKSHWARSLSSKYKDSISWPIAIDFKVWVFVKEKEIPPLLPKILIGSLDRDCSHCRQKVTIKAIWPVASDSCLRNWELMKILWKHNTQTNLYYLSTLLSTTVPSSKSWLKYKYEYA